MEGTLPPVRARLDAMIAEARAAHPHLRFDAAAYANHVLARVPAGTDVAAHLATLHAPDLLVAHKCEAGDAAAIAAFEKRCFDEIPFAVARIRPRATADEIAQMMRERLFVAGPEGAAKIASYQGAGDLRGWFRVVLVRHLLNMVSKKNREVDLDDAMLEALPAAATDPELDLARRMYAPALKDALVAAIGGLEPRDRTLLRLAVCDEMNVDEIGALYGVHRATAARWVATARDRLEEGTRERLRTALGARDESVASLYRLLASQMNVSLRGYLLSSEKG